MSGKEELPVLPEDLPTQSPEKITKSVYGIKRVTSGNSLIDYPFPPNGQSIYHSPAVPSASPSPNKSVKSSKVSRKIRVTDRTNRIKRTLVLTVAEFDNVEEYNKSERIDSPKNITSSNLRTLSNFQQTFTPKNKVSSSMQVVDSRSSPVTDSTKNLDVLNVTSASKKFDTGDEYDLNLNENSNEISKHCGDLIGSKIGHVNIKKPNIVFFTDNFSSFLPSFKTDDKKVPETRIKYNDFTIPKKDAALSVVDSNNDWFVGSIIDEIFVIDNYFHPDDLYRRIIENWDGNDENAENCSWIEIVQDNSYLIKQASVQKTYEDLVELAHRMRFGKFRNHDESKSDVSKVFSQEELKFLDDESIPAPPNWQKKMNLIKVTKWKNNVYENTFSGIYELLTLFLFKGNGCLDWMLTNLKEDWGLVDRQMAFHLASSLLACGFIRPCIPSRKLPESIVESQVDTQFTNPFVMPFLQSPVVCFCPCQFCFSCRSTNNLNIYRGNFKCCFQCTCCSISQCPNSLKRSHPPVSFVDGLYFYQWTDVPPVIILNPCVEESTTVFPVKSNLFLSDVSISKVLIEDSVQSDDTDEESSDGSSFSSTDSNTEKMIVKMKQMDTNKFNETHLNSLNQRNAAIHHRFVPPLLNISSASVMKPIDNISNTIVLASAKFLDLMIQLYRSINFKVPTGIAISSSKHCQSLYTEYKHHISAYRSFNLDRLNQESLLSFFLNVYNALYMHLLIVSDLSHDSGNKQKRLVLTRRCAYEIGGASYSIMDIKYAVLRANLPFPEVKQKDRFILLPPSFTLNDSRRVNIVQKGDPRVIFALCNGTKSSPRLQIYLPHSVYEQLEAATANYISEHIKVSHKPSASSAAYHLNAIAAPAASVIKDFPQRDLSFKNPPSKLTLSLRNERSRGVVAIEEASFNNKSNIVPTSRIGISKKYVYPSNVFPKLIRADTHELSIAIRSSLFTVDTNALVSALTPNLMEKNDIEMRDNFLLNHEDLDDEENHDLNIQDEISEQLYHSNSNKTSQFERRSFGISSSSFQVSSHTATGDSWAVLRVTVPKLFDWYRNDFGKSSQNVLKWIATHHPDVFRRSQILDFLGARSAVIDISRYIWDFDGTVFSPSVKGSFAS